MRGVSYLLTFTKPLPNHPDIELKLQLIVASRSPMEVILYFHSTVVLNVIAWDAAYSLYPCSTFEDRASLFLRDKASIEKAIVDKYIARGWTFKSHLPFSRGIRDIALTSVPRWIGDGHSWVIQLETAGIVFPPPINRLSRALTRDPSFVTCWIVEPNGERGGSSIGFEMTAKETGLFHQYPVLGWQLQDALDLIHSQWDAKPAVTVSPDVKIREYYDQQLIEVAERRQWQPPHKVMRVLF